MVIVRPIIARRKTVLLFILLMVAVLSALPGSWWLANVVGRVLLLPRPPEQDLRHFVKSRSLHHYLSDIEVLIEPTQSSCESLSSIPVLILVASVPQHFQHREMIRKSWAKYQPTYFVIGTHKSSVEIILGGNYMEAKQYNDIILFDFHDHYQNLTLKTALMLQWASSRCPQVRFLLKTDDDVLVNPWTLQEVIRDHPDAQLLGFSINNTRLHRDQYNKYYVPRWLCRENLIDQYLSGTAYLVNGAYMKKILQTSYSVPLLNIEDVYITHLVARKALNLTLSHDRRLSPKRPWVPFVCVYWNLATVHSLRPAEVMRIWPHLQNVARDRKRKSECGRYSFFNSDFFLY
ncbi:unnamed protein product, partial [Iphiclides podalirius]